MSACVVSGALEIMTRLVNNNNNNNNNYNNDSSLIIKKYKMQCVMMT